VICIGRLLLSRYPLDLTFNNIDTVALPYEVMEPVRRIKDDKVASDFLNEEILIDMDSGLMSHKEAIEEIGKGWSKLVEESRRLNTEGSKEMIQTLIPCFCKMLIRKQDTTKLM